MTPTRRPSYVRSVILAAVVAGLAYAGGRWFMAGLVVGYACFVAMVLWAIRDHGPADPPPVSQLRQRQVVEYCRKHEVRQ